MSPSENAAVRTCPKCEQRIDADSESCPACGKLFVAAQCDTHPERAAEGACVICGRRVCPEDDGVERSYYVCDAHSDIPVFEGWAQVYKTADDIEAQLIRDNLEAEGIDAEVLSQRDRALAFDLGDFSQVRVLVPAFSFLDAREALKQQRNAEGLA